MLLSEKELINKIIEKEIVPVKCCYDIEKNEIILDNNEIESLIEYAVINNIKHIFYKYYYEEIEDYIIHTNQVEHEDFYTLASKDIKSHNKKVKSLDFGQPALLVVFCLHQGALILIHKDASWAEGLLKADCAMKIIESKYAEQMADIKRKQQIERDQRREVLEEELKNKMLKDEEFSRCTNQRMRKLYIDTLLAKTENNKFKELFMIDPNNYFPGKAATFAEMVWSFKKSINIL